MSSLLLDTNALIRMVTGAPLRPDAAEALAAAAHDGRLWLSAVTTWELGLLADRGRTGPALGIRPDPEGWLRRVTERARLRHLPLGTSAALAAAFLPGPFHADPADRLLIAQARENAMTLVTRDRSILDYAALGHVRAIAC